MTNELSPAQKAAQTRRLNKLAREHVAAVKVGTTEVSPVAGARFVAMNLGDDYPVGCGYRELVVLSLGPKWATVSSIPTLQRFKIDRRTFDKSAKPVDVPVKVLVARVKDRAAMFKRLMADTSSDRLSVAAATLEALAGA